MISLQTTFEIDHPVALVTGSGAARVGRAIATRLAAGGCHLALHARESVTQAEETAELLRCNHSIETTVVEGDLADTKVAENLVRRVAERFGRLDILVNSAAIWFPTPLERVTPEEVRRYFDINSLAVFLASREAGQVMRGQSAGGAIVNLGDWATARPYVDHAAYFPSKGAIDVMTRSLAVELSRWNPRIRVNCIKPGPVLLTDDVADDQRRRLAASTLLGRVGTPEAIAHAVNFVCENDFLTGVCLPVDGGRTVFSPDGLQHGLNTG